VSPDQEIPVIAVPIRAGNDGRAGQAEVDHVVKPPPSTLEKEYGVVPLLVKCGPLLPVGRPTRISSLSKEAFQDPGDPTTFDDGIKAGQEA
jgi:hypothetical protein